ncbi:MAG: hypothetical protein KDE14_03315, partial [Rhodobacteraceae bacterium]|nr:hypothetical protein [Paracoccaceae bacterium]
MLELRYVGRAFLLGIYMSLVMLGVSLVLALIYFLGRVVGLEQLLGWLSTAGMIVLGVAAFFAIFVIVFRWSAALLPCAFDSPLEIKPAWKISKSVWKPLILLGIVTAIVFAIVITPVIILAPGASDNIVDVER